jgi:hypothetical protein
MLLPLTALANPCENVGDEKINTGVTATMREGIADKVKCITKESHNHIDTLFAEQPERATQLKALFDQISADASELLWLTHNAHDGCPEDCGTMQHSIAANDASELLQFLALQISHRAKQHATDTSAKDLQWEIPDSLDEASNLDALKKHFIMCSAIFQLEAEIISFNDLDRELVDSIEYVARGAMRVARMIEQRMVPDEDAKTTDLAFLYRRNDFKQQYRDQYFEEHPETMAIVRQCKRLLDLQGKILSP